jgi:hypothetical protein
VDANERYFADEIYDIIKEDLELMIEILNLPDDKVVKRLLDFEAVKEDLRIAKELMEHGLGCKNES